MSVQGMERAKYVQSPCGVRTASVICRVGKSVTRIKLRKVRCEGNGMTVGSEEWVGEGWRREALGSLRVRGRSRVALFKGRAVR